MATCFLYLLRSLYTSLSYLCRTHHIMCVQSLFHLLSVSFLLLLKSQLKYEHDFMYSNNIDIQVIYDSLICLYSNRRKQLFRVVSATARIARKIQ